MDNCSLFIKHSNEIYLINDKGSDRNQKLVQKLSDALFSSFSLILCRVLSYSVILFLIFGGLIIKSLSFLFWYNYQCTCLFGYNSRLSNQPFQDHDEQQQESKNLFKARYNLGP